MKLNTFALALGLFGTACSASDPSVPSGQLQIYETCLQTLCDQMTSHDSSACSACESACMSAPYDCDPSSACAVSCSPSDCSDYDKNTCAEQGYKVTLPNNPSPDIASACRDELQHAADCGYTASITAADCDRYAAVEVPDRASNYECVAQLPCSSLTDPSALSACDVPPSSFGDDFCASLASACPSDSCSSERQSLLDAEGAWLRSDAMAALQTCLSQPSCAETSKCVSAWLSAVE